MLELKKSRNQQSLNNDRKNIYFLDSNTALRKHFLKVLANFVFLKKLSVISNISCKKQSKLLLHLWLGAVIQGQYLLRLRINSVAIKKKKKLPGVSTVVLDKDENWLYKGFNDIEVVIATE